MPEQCTIYCRVKDCDSLEKRLVLLAPISVEFDGGEPWSICMCKISSGMLQISRKVFEKRGDDFARIVYTTSVEFHSREDDNPEGAKRVVDHLEETQLLLGIVADPDFESIEKVDELVAKLAAEYDGLIFNGAEMLDFRGNVIA